MSRHFKLLHYSLVLLLLHSCSEVTNLSQSSAISDPLPPSTPETNTLYTTMQWETSSPAEEGMDSALLDAAFNNAFADDTFTQAGIVIRNERIVYEQYRGITASEKQILIDQEVPNEIAEEYDFRDEYSLTSSWSVAKSFLSILIGVAIDKGLIPSIESLASDYIYEWENDARAQIKIKDLLNMRSGLEPLCRDNEDYSNPVPIVCTSFPSSGGDLLLVSDITEECINREIADVGVIQPWYTDSSAWEEGYFLYINCDSQVLGKILERAVGNDLETFAEVNLFSKIGFDNYWWSDSTGNHTAYCCLDATARDFAKFGQLVLNFGMWGNEQIVSRSYINKIISIYPTYIPTERGSSYAYGMQFWTFSFPITQPDGTEFPTYPIYSAIGFDGQYVIIDFEQNMVIVRNSLYFPWIKTGERTLSPVGDLMTEVNVPMTLPNTMGIPIYFDRSTFLYEVHKSLLD